MDFKAKYHRESYLTFFSTLFGNGNFQKIDRTTPLHESSLIKNSYFQKVQTLGLVHDLEGLEDGLIVLEIEHQSSRDARVTLTKELVRLLQNTELEGEIRGHALVIFTNPQDDTYRLSLFTTSYDKSAGFKKVLSNPRRQSFLLGLNRVHTPQEQLVKKGAIVSFEDLKKRFSIEVVNKEFYSKIAEFFYELTGGTIMKGKQKIVKTPVMFYPLVTNEKARKEFGVRLFGRVMFCWFLKQKLLDDGNGLIPSTLLSSKAVQGGRYYNDILEPLFFQILNKPQEERELSFNDINWKNIPYLNGGLFHPQDEDFIEKAPNEVVIPDSWFQGFFEFLELYNFTIDENTSIDQEMSVDPEMLGRIFENLLAEINPETGESARKSTGSFYTPREIVEYMVDESIIQYLLTHLDISEDKIRSLVSYDLDDDVTFPLNETDKKEVFERILSMKIFDPACGSGAYPIGILQKILYIMQTIDLDGTLWMDQKLSEISDPMQRAIMRKAYESKDINYLRKLTIIRDIIYGCDIQSIAVETSKLRCFLTLIVDEKVDKNIENFGIEPLPNLEFKFVCANTLLPINIDIGVVEKMNNDIVFGKKKKERQYQIALNLGEQEEAMKEIFELRQEYFSSHHTRKKEIKKQISVHQENLLLLLTTGSLGGDLSGEYATEVNKLIDWDMFGHKSAPFFDLYWMYGMNDGFDIVIGNPPYGAEISENEKEIFKENYISAKTEKSEKGSIDTFSIFTDIAISKLTKKLGILSYILPMSVTSGDSMSKLHKLILTSSSLILLSSYSDRPKKIFLSAETACSIVIVRKGNIDKPKLMTTKVNKRYSDQESIEDIIRNLKFIDSIEFIEKGRIPKIGEEIEQNILRKIKKNNFRLANYINPNGSGFFYRSSGGRYYKLITNYSTGSSKEKVLLIDTKFTKLLCAIFSSNLYFWYYHIYSNNLDLKSGDIDIFPIPNLSTLDDNSIKSIEVSYDNYTADLEKNSEIQIQNRANVSEVKTFYARKSKVLIDELDRLIGPFFGLNEEEIGFVISYDLKFRIDE